jgi:hypothetical protein
MPAQGFIPWDNESFTCATPKEFASAVAHQRVRKERNELYISSNDSAQKRNAW